MAIGRSAFFNADFADEEQRTRIFADRARVAQGVQAQHPSQEHLALALSDGEHFSTRISRMKSKERGFSRIEQEQPREFSLGAPLKNSCSCSIRVNCFLSA